VHPTAAYSVVFYVKTSPFAAGQAVFGGGCLVDILNQSWFVLAGCNRGVCRFLAEVPPDASMNEIALIRVGPYRKTVASLVSRGKSEFENTLE